MTRYVDILIIYNSALGTVELVLEDHNSAHPKIKHNMETESNQSINFLLLNIYGKTDEIML
jgi:hypothetical protein